MLLPSPASQKDKTALVIITTNERMDAKTILKQNMPDAEQRKHGDKTYFVAKKDGAPAVHFVNDHMVVIGDEKALVNLMDGWKGQRGDGVLGPSIKMAAEHHIAGAFRVLPEHLMKFKDGKQASDDDALRALRELKFGTFTMDFGNNKTTARVILTLPNDTKAKEAVNGVRKGLDVRHVHGKRGHPKSAGPGHCRSGNTAGPHPAGNQRRQG